MAPAAGAKGDGDSGCGTDSEEEMEEEHRTLDGRFLKVFESRPPVSEKCCCSRDGHTCVFSCLHLIHSISDGNDVMFAQHISEAEYEKQKTDYTRQALDALIQSPEYQKKYKSCRRLGQLHYIPTFK